MIRPIDKSKNNEPKNFCFVTFERERVAKNLIDEGTCVINGHKMMVNVIKDFLLYPGLAVTSTIYLNIKQEN